MQASWPHWQGSHALVLRQLSLQYSWPAGTWHMHWGWAHFCALAVVAFMVWEMKEDANCAQTAYLQIYPDSGAGFAMTSRAVLRGAKNAHPENHA